MLFKKDNKVPAEIKKTNLETWYEGLDDKNRMILGRYLAGADVSSQYAFFTDIIKKTLAEENHKFCVKLCQDVYSVVPTDDYEKFKVNEYLIQAYFMGERYDDVKAACEMNFGLFPKIRDRLVEEYGSVPETLYFRNRYIDVIVGVESAYDYANEMLVKYNEMGILSDEDLEYRKNSLKTHRLQRVFDGVYTYRPKGE